MAMATQGLADQDHAGHQQQGPSEPTTTTNSSSSSSSTHHASSLATNRWGPYSGAGDFASNMAVILAALLAALALGLALNAAVRYLLRRHRHAGAGAAGARDADHDPEEGNRGAVLEEGPEKPPVQAPPPPPPPLPALVYSTAATKQLAGAAAECAICLAEFVDGDAVRVMPACRHGFHARCIERWLAGGRRSSCPTCRAPAAVVDAGSAAAPAQPDEAAAAPSSSS